MAHRVHVYGVMCVLTALHHRNVTGQGQHVDLSQMSAGITLTGSAFLDHTVNGRAARREGYPPGNRTAWPGSPPLNSYRGPTVASLSLPYPSVVDTTTGASSRAFPMRSGRPWSISWAVLVGRSRRQFGNLSGRLQHQEELDQGIERWTQTRREIRADGEVPGRWRACDAGAKR